MDLEPVVVSLRGPVRWAWRDQLRLSATGQTDKAALVDDQRIVITLTSENEIYSIVLNRSFGDSFEGEWHRASTGERGRASGTLYRSQGNCFFFGEWFQEGDQFWWAELSVLPDES